MPEKKSKRVRITVSSQRTEVTRTERSASAMLTCFESPGLPVAKVRYAVGAPALVHRSNVLRFEQRSMFACTTPPTLQRPPGHSRINEHL